MILRITLLYGIIYYNGNNNQQYGEVVRLSTRGRYGIRAVLELALNEEKGPVSLKDIALKQDISVQYLEHLITPLIAGGIAKSTRGAKGGISLARPAQTITISEILRLLEGSPALVECLDNPDICERPEYCSVKDFWSIVTDTIENVLRKITIKDLSEQQKQKELSEAIMYYI